MKKRHYKLGELTHNATRHAIIAFFWKILREFLFYHTCCIIDNYSLLVLKEPQNHLLTEVREGRLGAFAEAPVVLPSPAKSCPLRSAQFGVSAVLHQIALQLGE